MDNFENAILQLIKDNEQIQDINQTLSFVYNENISPSFCSSLFIPLIQHAIENSRLEDSIDIYIKTLTEIHAYNIEMDCTGKGQHVFDNCVVLVKDIVGKLEQESIFNVHYDLSSLEDEKLLDLLAIAIETCSCMILKNLDDFIDNSNMNTLWTYLSCVFDYCSIITNTATITIIKAATNICDLLTQTDLINLPVLNNGELLHKLILLMNEYDLPNDSLDQIAKSISMIIEKYPNIKLNIPSEIASVTNSIVSSIGQQEQQLNPIRAKALLNASCLLMKNYTKAPWLNDILIITNYEELEILKEKSKLLLKITEDTAFLNSQIEYMEIDQDSLYHNKQSINSIVECKQINEILAEKAGPIINELILLNEGDVRCYNLIAKLKDISIYTDNTEISIICAPYIKDIAEFATRLLVVDPSITESIGTLFGYEIPQFMSKYLQYTLPFAIIHTADNDTLLGIATALGADVQELCRPNVHHILLPLLMEEDQGLKALGYRRLQQIFKILDAEKVLATRNATKLTTLIAMNLGIPSLKEKSQTALIELQTLVGLSGTSISEFLSQFFMGVMSKITNFISEKRIRSTEIENPHAFEALKELMVLIKPDINDYALHLMKVFQTVNELDGMQLEALSLWQQFISVLNNQSLITHLNGIIKGLIQMLSTSNHRVRFSASQVINDLIIHKSEITSPHFHTLPLLPEFEELKLSRQYVEKILAVADYEIRIERGHDAQLCEEIEQIINNLTDPNDLQISTKLQKLSKFITDYPTFPIERDAIYTRLLYLIRKYSNHKEISHLAAICLGKVGAYNPSLVNVKILDDQFIVKENFKTQAENREFICNLIINHIFPVYNGTSNEEIQRFMQFSIQKLLEYAGFTALSQMQARRNATYQRWLKLPPFITEFLKPFLQSSYEISWENQTTQYPIFSQAKNFIDWIQKWYCQIANGAISEAKKILEACIPIVISNFIDITAFLLPYSVLHTILSGTNDDIRNIAKEMLTILDTAAEPDDNSDRGKMNYQALQVVVSITEYCRKWLNNVKFNDRSKTSQVDRVIRFLDLIPDKTMAIAAYNSRAYPQALMHLETWVKNQPNGMLEDPDILKYLRLLFNQLDNANDLVLLLETHTEVMSHDEEIVRFEAAGKWHEAETLYKNKILENPNDIACYTGFMDCLKKWGNHESVIYFADLFSAKTPKMASHLNSIKIDSAWRLEDWNVLDKAVRLPMEKTPEAFIGCILSKMRKGQNLDAACYIEEARSNLIETLSGSSTDSYKKLYPTIFHLQLLQELQDAQTAWEVSDPVEKIRDLYPKWKSNYKSIASSYLFKQNLLQLRKAAFFDIRPQLHSGIKASELWLDLSKLSRKVGNGPASLDAIFRAEKMGGVSCYKEKAKWYWSQGYKVDAISLLNTTNGISVGNTVKVVEMQPEDALVLTKFYNQDPTIFSKLGYKPDIIRLYYAASLKHNEKIGKAHHNAVVFYITQYPEDDRLVINRLKVLFYVIRSSVKSLVFGAKYYYSSMSHIVNAWFELAKYEKETPIDSKLLPEIKKTLADVNSIMSGILESVPPFQFTLFLTRLISHLAIDNGDIAKCLINIISAVFVTYPRSSIWFLQGALQSKVPFVAARVHEILKKAKAAHSTTAIPRIILQTNQFVNTLYDLAAYKVDEGITQLDMSQSTSLSNLVMLRNLDIQIPTEASLYPTLPEVIKGPNSGFGISLSESTHIAGIEKIATIMKSLQKPKKIVILGSDGKKYGFLVKSNDDLRKDARTMEFNNMINSFLKRNSESRDSDLYIRTYSVIPLGEKWGLIQWIDNLQPLKKIVNDLWQAQGFRSAYEMTIAMKRDELMMEREIIRRFKKVILPQCPAVFYKWFLKSFPEPNHWLSSRTRYIKTCAVMSIVGYMLGLGDRHAENILFDETNGDCFHVDLNMLFDLGAGLDVPEIVPFRLTHNLVDAMGIVGYKGSFTKMCEITMDVLLANKDALLGVFQTLLNDEDQQKPPSMSSATHMKKMEKRFELQRGETANNKVGLLIETAANEDNLAKMYPGWAPFL